jgi:hypothetical protein
MLYLGIDLHSKQLTISLRGADGEMLLRRQVSTRGEKAAKFLEGVASCAGACGGSCRRRRRTATTAG